ncbi:protein LURP-one-related 8-like [Oryza brachyantha]|uniref:protein LURP-one-related 8-like n=1 Tax=Oryza brachyantha TaxID=4533 RepID=UPI001ADBBDEA|nr:protein LURP-one-related 8-like [Oryza brachyantha]
MAAKVHPNVAVPEPPCISAGIVSQQQDQDQPPVVLTVWRKSLLFNCHGFTVFDAKGNLAFRVDCYDASSSTTSRRPELVLMDVAGNPLLTIRRKRLCLSDNWIIYDGDGEGASTPLLSVRRHLRRGLRASKALAHVTPLSSSLPLPEEAYVVEGSYGRRACAVRDARGDAVAEVRRKESVGDDVFRLVAEPRLGAPLAMAIVIAIDEMFRGGSSLLRRTCSA